MHALQTSLLLALCVAICSAGIRFGKCPATYETEQSFDLDRYVGDWYQIARDARLPYGRGECGTATYVPDVQRPSEAFVLNQQRKRNSDETKEFPIFGKVKPTGESGRFELTFSTVFAKGTYEVLETDYKSYSVVYTCGTIAGFLTTEYVWILSRDPSLGQGKINDILDNLESNTGYSRNNLVFTDQSDCGWQ